jgi:hypothetical protein
MCGVRSNYRLWRRFGWRLNFGLPCPQMCGVVCMWGERLGACLFEKKNHPPAFLLGFFQTKKNPMFFFFLGFCKTKTFF